MANVNPPPHSKLHSSEDAPVRITATEARQGTPGRPVLVVLVAALLLAMIAWAASEMWGNSIAPVSNDAATSADQAPATEPASENEAIINDNPPAGEVPQTQPVVIDPKTP